ncbi:maleylpyruvate isomerase N-terminal domain-containing protein [Nocardia sp. NPDC050717]|uniref:maleylpyruvate isomerase family mycothiol-dependent enzyme n=1 Tax=Nocardia sp. NPDC050717 TaxID=3157221 RepID=UPI003401B7A1
MSDNAVATYVQAVESFRELVREIAQDRWDGPGLGEWDLRALVGHTSRSLTTVTTYLADPAETEDIASPQEYYAYVKSYTAQAGGAAVVARGRAAGLELGAEPAKAVDALATAAIGAVGAVGAAEDPLVTVIGGLGMRLHAYLPTRTFELAVHGLDIAAATGIPYTPPDDVTAEAAVLAARIAARLGTAVPVLTALTGRTALPPGFSVV